MIHIQSMQLQEVIRKLDAGEEFSFTRYWDGEMACIVGRPGKNVDSCDYTEPLRLALRNTLLHPKGYYHGVFFPTWHRNTVNLRRQFEEYLIHIGCKVQWYDAMIFQRAFETGSFFPVIRALKNRNCVFVGGEHLRPIEKLIEPLDFVEAPSRNAFERLTELKSTVRSICAGIEKPVVIFCIGMASNCIIDDLYGEVSATMLDMGSVWDAALKLRTRIWMRSIPENVIRRNLNG